MTIQVTEPEPVIITASPHASVLGIRARAAWTKGIGVLIVAMLSLLVADALALRADNPFLVAGFTGAAVLTPILWFRPAVGVYILVVGAALFESFSLNFPDSLTDKVPFFKSFASLGSPIPLPFTLAETVMFLALAVIAVKRMVDRKAPLEMGPLSWGIGLYSVALVGGFIHGVATGGDVNIALWEVRAPLYLFLVYILAFTALHDRTQVQRLIWLLLIAIATKGLLGTWRFLVTLGGDLSKVPEVSTFNSLLSHEESLFLAFFLATGLLLYLFRSNGKQLKFVALFSLPVLIAFLANERRAGIMAFVIMAGVIGLFAFALIPERRKRLGTVAAVSLLLFPPYAMAFGNSDGIFAQPARAVMSAFVPDPRDLSSNSYRVAETESLKQNIARNPLLGAGYGKPIVWYVPIPDLSHLFSFWAYIPHNTVLWIWLRLGFLGFIAFWFLVGRIIVQGATAARNTDTPYLRGIAVLTVATITAWIALGALDMGFADFRSTILIGALVAAMARMSPSTRRTSMPADGAAVQEERPLVIEPSR